MDNPLSAERFIDRHIGPRDSEIKQMLNEIGFSSMDELIDKTVPKNIRLQKDLNIPEAISEYDYFKKIRNIASKNKIFKSYQGQGYYPTILPKVIQRNILENPGWYTQYTPYQAEISQGRLEALFNYQSMIVELTGLPISNASLLDEGTAAAEAMLMCYNMRKNKTANKIFIANDLYPQTLDVLITRAEPFGLEIVRGEKGSFSPDENYFAIIFQYPDNKGCIDSFEELIKTAKANNIYSIAIADLMSLVLLKSPGELGCDAAAGTTQRFGVPMMYGGPHAAYFAAKEDFKRFIPGRIIGISIDRNGFPAYRMALQTREQHIKREKATSNICTSQVLLAIMAGMYTTYHGREGIISIAERIHYLTGILDDELQAAGFEQLNKIYFDTLKIKLESNELDLIKKDAESKSINFRYFKDGIGISINETTNLKDIKDVLEIFGKQKGKYYKTENLKTPAKINVIPDKLLRKDKFLSSEVFNKYHSETEFMRYVKSLENKDLSLTGSMIPLGSCTMKLNAASEMIPVSFPEFTEIHPFSPQEQAAGFMIIVNELGKYLCEITGFSGITFQPNSGAQGEYTGLMIIRNYFKSIEQSHRNVVLIPCSAHGTNPASAIMAGMKVVVVNCDENGNIDVADLKKKTEEHKKNLSCLMVTYPSTHGVFEEEILDICDTIHKVGGQVYMDGANMNAQVGLTSPAAIGADVCHLNLHKTFAIPHGGGGPGEGPVAVAKHLVPFLPEHVSLDKVSEDGMTAVSAAPFGSAGILAISYGYILMSGAAGLKKSTETAILNANYVMEKLKDDFKTLYKGANGRVGHELIFDFREFKHTVNIEVIDAAKRLMDFGFHAPTVSFPVGGTLMFEPTESEPKSELDRFIKAMKIIRNEINEIIEGTADKTDNVLKNAPHTAFEISSDEWKHAYGRKKAAYPVEELKVNKFWPSVGRINDAHGDRNLICSCRPITDYTDK